MNRITLVNNPKYKVGVVVVNHSHPACLCNSKGDQRVALRLEYSLTSERKISNLKDVILAHLNGAKVKRHSHNVLSGALKKNVKILGFGRGELSYMNDCIFVDVVVE